MKKYKCITKNNNGSALIVAMILIVICSAMAVAIAAMAGSNIQLAANQYQVGKALASAESGLEIQRYWLTPVSMPSSTPQTEYFNAIVDAVQYDLDANNISNIVCMTTAQSIQ